MITVNNYISPVVVEALKLVTDFTYCYKTDPNLCDLGAIIVKKFDDSPINATITNYFRKTNSVSISNELNNTY